MLNCLQLKFIPSGTVFEHLEMWDINKIYHKIIILITIITIIIIIIIITIIINNTISNSIIINNNINIK